jgi:uncharacterized membrane protein
MTVLLLLLSVIAFVFKVFPPKKINYLYGYRTSSSMKNIENWNLANKFSANLLLASMLVLLFFSYILDLQNIEATNWLIGLLMVTFGVMIFLTEKKLKENEVSKL